MAVNHCSSYVARIHSVYAICVDHFFINFIVIQYVPLFYSSLIGVFSILEKTKFALLKKE